MTNQHPQDQDVLNRMADCGCTLAVLDAVSRALERARVAGDLDAWRIGAQVADRATWCMGWRNACVLQKHDMATGELVSEHVFEGSDPHAARAAAVKAIKEGKL